jgi:predicted transcriptional regulator of viral defense system
MTVSTEKWMKEHEKSDQKAFQAIHNHMDRLDKSTNNDLVVYKIDELKVQFGELERKIDNNFVTKTEFDPIKRLVYGTVALMLTSVLGAIVALVLRS